MIEVTGDRPLCVAARTAALIDPDKSVRPCCNFGRYGHYLRDSDGVDRVGPDHPLRAVLQGETWQRISADLAAGRVPEGCSNCLQWERDTGHVFRRWYDSPAWEGGLTLLELNTSNVCTLQCRHCGPHLSHRWAIEFGMPVQRADSQLLLESLRSIDLSHLERLVFKGGEPLLNPDVAVALEYVRDLGRLPAVDVLFVTNGTIVDSRHIELLASAKSVAFTLSVDGVGAVQSYVRHGPSDNEQIERFLATYVQRLPRAYFSLLTSVMAFNVHSLPAIAEWWSRLSAAYPHRLSPASFHHFVMDPPHLSVSVLRDEMRARLAADFQRLDSRLYANVVQTLQLPFAGEELRQRFRQETRERDVLLGRSWRDCVPELASELGDEA